MKNLISIGKISISKVKFLIMRLRPSSIESQILIFFSLSTFLWASHQMIIIICLNILRQDRRWEVTISLDFEKDKEHTEDKKRIFYSFCCRYFLWKSLHARDIQIYMNIKTGKTIAYYESRMIQRQQLLFTTWNICAYWITKNNNKFRWIFIHFFFLCHRRCEVGDNEYKWRECVGGMMEREDCKNLKARWVSVVNHYFVKWIMKFWRLLDIECWINIKLSLRDLKVV